MKHIVLTLLWAALLMQQTRAAILEESEPIDHLKFIKPPTEKSFPLYDFIATTINNYTLNEMFIYGQTIAEFLNNERMFNTAELDRAQIATRPFIEALEQLYEDQDNCELQRRVRKEFKGLHANVMTNTENSRFCREIIWDSQRKQSMQYLKFFKKFFEHLTQMADNYLQSVDEFEMMAEPIELLRWCALFPDATNMEQKQSLLWNFWQMVVEVDEASSELDKPDCKWDYQNFQDFWKSSKKFHII